ncbi:MAG: formyltransferase family protein [Bergeyella sp.]
MRYVFAGDRQISCIILGFLIGKGFYPEALFVTDGVNATHSEELIRISGLEESRIFKGKEVIKNGEVLGLLHKMELDYIIGIHYPYIISKELLEIPKIGFLNLHPAYLPFNKGWNTPSWAILDKSVYGATLHFMSEELDKGDIIHQKKIEVATSDTANSLYQKVLKLEEEIFFEAFDGLVQLNPKRIKQETEGSSYKKSDLQKIREFFLDEEIVIGDFLDKLRALTTNNPDEMAYFKEGERKIGVKIEFVELSVDFYCNELKMNNLQKKNRGG